MLPLANYAEMSATDSVPTYSYVIAELRKRHPGLAYIHAIEPRIEGISEGPTVPNGASNDFIRELWHEKRLITNAGYTRESGMQIANEKGDLIAYGRPFIANVGVHVLFGIGAQVTDPNRSLARSAVPPTEKHSTHYRRSEYLLRQWESGSDWIYLIPVCRTVQSSSNRKRDSK